MSRFCLHRFRKQDCKARDPISRRTVTFGETAHKRYTLCRTCGWQRRRRYCNAWQGCFANSLPTVCRLCRKQMFSFSCMQQDAHTPGLMLTRRLAPAGTGTSAASPARSAKHFATAATVGAAARRPLGLQGLRLWAGIPRAPHRRAHNQLCE